MPDQANHAQGEGGTARASAHSAHHLVKVCILRVKLQQQLAQVLQRDGRLAVEILNPEP